MASQTSIKTQLVVCVPPLSPMDSGIWCGDWDWDGPDMFSQPVPDSEPVSVRYYKDFLHPVCLYPHVVIKDSTKDPPEPIIREIIIDDIDTREEPDIPTLESPSKAKRFFQNLFKRKKKPKKDDKAKSQEKPWPPPHPGPFRWSLSWLKAKAAFEWHRHDMTPGKALGMSLCVVLCVFLVTIHSL